MTHTLEAARLPGTDAGLLIVGASVRAAAQSAVRGGFDVVAGDLFADRDLRDIAECVRIRRYPGEFTAVRATWPSRPLIYTGALENYPELLDELGGSFVGPLLGNCGRVVRLVRDPFVLQSALHRAGIPSPALRRSPPPASQAGQWLQKPYCSAGGRNIRIPKMHPTRHTDRGRYFQRFVPGQPCSAAYLATRSQCHWLGTTEMLVGRRWGGPADYAYCGSIGRPPPPEQRMQWEHIGRTVARGYGLIGLFGIDGILDAGRIWPLEINPRYTASMELIEPDSDQSLVSLHVAACHGRDVTPPVQTREGWLMGKAIVYAPHDLQVQPGFEQRRWPARGGSDGWGWIADVPDEGHVVRRGHPLVSVLVRAPTRKQVRDALGLFRVQVLEQTRRLG